MSVAVHMLFSRYFQAISNSVWIFAIKLMKKWQSIITFLEGSSLSVSPTYMKHGQTGSCCFYHWSDSNRIKLPKATISTSKKAIYGLELRDIGPFFIDGNLNRKIYREWLEIKMFVKKITYISNKYCNFSTVFSCSNCPLKYAWTSVWEKKKNQISHNVNDSI